MPVVELTWRWVFNPFDFLMRTWLTLNYFVFFITEYPLLGLAACHDS